jgi:S-adenosylmethionine:tRNA ribosyltransferase-isomerase
MLVSAFDYYLPQELIAQTPLPQRDQSRMMICDRATGEISHTLFRDIPEYFRKHDTLVLNSSKVLPAKIWGKSKDDKSIEFLFLEEKNKNEWVVLCRPAKHVKQGDEIFFRKDYVGRVAEVKPEGKRLLVFPHAQILAMLKELGFAPLPPYIRRKIEDAHSREEDLDRYQTVYAQKEGSIAAPTAGLHFTQELLDKLKNKGVTTCDVSLDVGQATFQPVRVDRVEDHHMLAENFFIPEKTSKVINTSLAACHRITAVGTTSVRTLESAIEKGNIGPGQYSTNLFIYPGFQFEVVDRLLTNFHLPKSTLLMLVAAFAGIDFILEAYREAVRHKYRFYSYGDCMLIL